MTSVERVEAPGPSRRESTSDSAYLPYLDGLRAVAVYLVVAFHVDIGRLAGGFIGVDIFFVLSGYLVTALLLRDIAAHGSIRLWRFYSRRFRRLLPAAVGALVITAVVYAAIAAPSAVDMARNGFVACFLYVGNWFFVHRSTDYFAAGAEPSPVLHFWSLAVEEQFYLFWPVIFGGLMWTAGRFARGRRLVVPIVVAAAALASVAWAFALKGAEPDRAYFGTDTRAYQLLAGALIALTPGVVRQFGRLGRALPMVSTATLAGLVVAGSWLIDVDPIERGVLATLLTVVLVVALAAGPEGLVHRLLSLEPVVYLGRISYGTYLWHWPVIIVAQELAAPDTKALLAITTLTATALASLSFQLLEHPIRRSSLLDRHHRLVISAGLAVSVIGGLVVMPRVLEDPRGSSTAAAAISAETGFHEVPRDLDLAQIYREQFATGPDCVGGDLEPCTLVHGSGPPILLMGDSNAEMMIPAFERLARDENLTLSVAVRSGCPWQRDVYHLTAEIINACRRSKADWYDRLIPTFDPGLIVVMNAEVLTATDAREYVETPFNRSVRSSTVSTLRKLSADGRKVLVIESMPAAVETFNPLDCLTTATAIEACRFVARPGPNWLDRLQRAEADDDPNVWSLDLDELACPFLPICDPIVNGRVTYWNNAHLTRRYAATLGPRLVSSFKELGLIPA